jgi:branched-chain amino acid transport system substrate-binding protein
MFYTVPVFADSTSSAYKEFVQTYKNKFGKEPGVPADPVYDATMLLLKGIKEMGNDPDKVKDYLLNVRNYEGASGRISFNTDGDVIKDFNIKSLKNSKDSIITKIVLSN